MSGQSVERWLVSGNGEAWRQCHASSLAVVGDAVCVAWFAGTAEGTPDNAIWLTRGRPGGRWDEPVVILDGRDGAWWNPVLSHGPEGDLWLFAKNGPAISGWRTWYARSADAGRTWSEPAELVPGDIGGRGPVKNPPLITSTGAWVAPGSVEGAGPNAHWDCRFDRSTDGGISWKLTDVALDHDSLTGAGIIQPTLWEGADGLAAVCRSTEGVAYRTTSTDDGLSWSPAVPILLANNNSGICATRRSDGSVFLAHNPVDRSWGPRCPLVVSVSRDEGLSWTRIVEVEDGIEPPRVADGALPRLPEPGAAGFLAADTGVVTDGRNEYSYPCTVLAGDGSLLVSYTWQRRGIVVGRIPPELLNR